MTTGKIHHRVMVTPIREEAPVIQVDKYYRCFGLRVGSEISMPLPQESDGSAAPDAEIIQTATIELPSWLEDDGGMFDVNRERGFFRYAGVGTFLIDKGRTIRVQPANGDGSKETLASALLGTPLGILLFQRGFLVFHGAAGVLEGRGAVFLGSSGAGKSSMAAAFSAERNGGFLADDVVCIEREGHPYRVIPSYPVTKLDRRVQRCLHMDGRVLYENQGKGILGVSDRLWKQDVELGAIYLPRWSGSSVVTIEALPPREAMVQIAAHAYGPSPRTRYPEETVEHFQHLAEMAARVPCFLVHRPKDLSQMDRVTRRLRAHFSACTAGAAAAHDRSS